MSELYERTLVNFRLGLVSFLVHRRLKAVTLCLLMYPSDKSQAIIEEVKAWAK